MSDNIVRIGKFGLVIPDEEMFKVATLQTDLRPALRALRRIEAGKRHPGRPRKVTL